MLAVTFTRYTEASGLALGEIPAPETSANRVIVRVAAAGLNPFDWHMYRGEPWIVRGSEGWRVASRRTVGADIAGVVDSVGRDVADFSPGDRVFGSIGLGGLAEFASARPSSLAKLAPEVAMADAAATPMAALTALQALRDGASLKKGERVLIWGASGGVGHFAVQLARLLGAARVDAVCSARNAEFVRKLNADEVFDYADSALPTGRYDIVIDTVATLSVRKLQSLLEAGGRIVTVGSVSTGKLLGPAAALVRRAVVGGITRVTTKGILATVNSTDLAHIAGWLADGRLRPSVQEIYPLTRFAEALATLEAGHVRGKLVVRMDDSER